MLTSLEEKLAQKLADIGFTSEEITSLVWLQRSYQTGGSDRAVLLRHWEFMKYLVHSGKLEA